MPFLVAVRCFADIMSMIDCHYIAKSYSVEVFVPSFDALVWDRYIDQKAHTSNTMAVD
jgi:hypothetical protein